MITDYRPVTWASSAINVMHLLMHTVYIIWESLNNAMTLMSLCPIHVIERRYLATYVDKRDVQLQYFSYCLIIIEQI